MNAEIIVYECGCKRKWLEIDGGTAYDLGFIQSCGKQWHGRKKLGLMPPQVGSEPYDLVAALHEAGYGQGHRKPAPQAIPDVAPARSEPQLAPRDPRCEAVMHEWEDVSWPEDLLTGPDIEQWRQAFRDGWNLALKYADKPPPTPTVHTSTVATQVAEDRFLRQKRKEAKGGTAHEGQTVPRDASARHSEH